MSIVLDKKAIVMEIEVKIKFFEHATKNDIKCPFYATEGSTGFDLQAAIDQDIVLKPNERVLVPTGIAIALPEGYEAQVRPRSGLAYKNGVTVLNTPGTVDSDYRGELKVILINLSNIDFILTKGQRIAQVVINQYVKAQFNIVKDLVKTIRNDKGFGSTGTH